MSGILSITCCKVRDYEQDEDEHSGQAALLDPGSGSRAARLRRPVHRCGTRFH
jgi:hypothetical protein